MDQNEGQQKLLLEIREILREQLQEYRRVTTEQLELQRQAVDRQRQLGRIYKASIFVAALLAMAAIWYLKTVTVVQ